MSRRPCAKSVVATVGIVSALVGCNGGAEPRTVTPNAPTTSAENTLEPDYTIEYSAADYSYAGPASTPPGPTRITMRNVGAEDHEMLVLKVPAAAKNLNPVDELSKASFGTTGAATVVAGIHGVSPGESGAAVVELTRGRYILGCTIPTPSDLVPHSLRGMIVVLTVR